MRTLLCAHCGAPLDPANGARELPCSFCGVTSLREAVAGAASTARPATTSHDDLGIACPRCALPLFAGAAGGANLAACGACGGIWLDNASAQVALQKLDGVVARTAEQVATRVRRTVDEQPLIKCPACRDVLARTKAPAALLIDVCQAHGTWFDRNELAWVLQAMRPRTAPPIDSRPLSPEEIPDFRAGTGPDVVQVGLVLGGAFTLMAALAGASKR